MGTSSDTFQAVTGMNTFALGKSSQVNIDITDIVLTAYSITSAYVSDGVCITTSEVPITLNTAYTITSPTSVPSSEFPAIAGSKFVEFLGFSNCVGSGEELFPTPIIPTTFSILVPAPSASLPASANSTTSPTLHPSNATEPTAAPGLDEPERRGIDVVVSSAGLILVFLVASIWRKRRLRAAAIAAGEQENTEDGQQGISASGADSQPYLQQKSELETEERRRHELEGRQKIHELDDQTGIFKIPAGTHEHRLAVMQTRQELKGGEHSQELGT